MRTETGERFMFSASVDSVGTIHPDEPNRTRGRLAAWNGQRVTVTVERYVRPKTDDQMGYYYARSGVLDCWAEYCGYDREEMHRELKLAYLDPILAVARLTGEEKLVVPSLADPAVNIEVVSAFLERVIREGNQRGIEFPPTRPKSSTRAAKVSGVKSL